MRVLIELEALKKSAYDLKYYHKLQGFIYDLFKGTPYKGLHDRDGYKFFCYSNIFPPKDMERGDKRNLLISSPERPLVKLVQKQLRELKDAEKSANIGDMSFKIREIKPLHPKVTRSCTLITGTPIVIRIPRENYERYNIKPEKDYNYLYWRKRYSFEAFIKQLEDNLHKKYRAYHNQKISEVELLFEEFVFKKQVCNHINVKGREIPVIGSIWKFGFNYLTEERQKIIQFGLDAGFGEMNSLGFGFMNVVR
ncbi:hypothetical protein AKJ45_02230 [candidate division MSBL1 archaeon SCGC-AAA261F19]|uniref:CRISPR associated protein Cas6 C-terminal domain-containing protein n=1 Tax=candidate division MSBL1 archaeon SCGC-AAA261F19 TaxID=1698275 RepID=A0A133V9S3_9EURY|nr:hypothetical protein AKJ45_02230 [candidate division MSBL1 archaeon SCGC-AAA261F19]